MPGEAGQDVVQASFAAPPGDEVAGDADEVGLPLHHPFDSAVDGAQPARRHTEMEVGEVRDAKAVELRREPGNRDLADA